MATKQAPRVGLEVTIHQWAGTGVVVKKAQIVEVFGAGKTPRLRVVCEGREMDFAINPRYRSYGQVELNPRTGRYGQTGRWGLNLPDAK